MTILHDTGVDQGGFGAAESASQQLTVLREAAGLDMMLYRTQVETKVDGQARGYHDDPGSSFRAPFGAAWLKRGTGNKKERIRRASKIMIRQKDLAKSEPNGAPSV